MSDMIKDPANISALQDLTRGVKSDIGRWIDFARQETRFPTDIWPLKKTDSEHYGHFAQRWRTSSPRETGKLQNAVHNTQRVTRLSK